MTISNATLSKHLAAIRAGAVTRSNIIGIRKAINAAERERHGWSTSRTSPKASPSEVWALESELERLAPRVAGELHDSGLVLLRSPRYRKALAPVADIIAAIDRFELVRFDRIGSRDQYATPVYRAISPAGSFIFRNIPWQSGGDGPEILGGPY